MADARTVAERVRSAGTIVFGVGASVAFGDYVTGANHVLPTGGLARAYAGLGVDDFLRWTTYQEIDGAAAARMAGPTTVLAGAEGLPAHAAAARAAGEAGGAGGAVGAGPGSAAQAGSPGSAARPVAGTTGRASPGRPPPSRTGPVPRAGIRSFELYDPERGGVELDVSDNTNLWGTGPDAATALATPDAGAAARYPTPYATRLKEAAASYFGVTPEAVTTGCGSDDLIDSAIRAFAGPGDVMAYQEPTFPMASVFARMNGARPVAVPPGPAFALNEDAFRSARPRVAYLCRPNNPTGTMFDRDAVRRVAMDVPGLVLVDEAYADFAGDTLIADAVASDRVVVLRTLSKAFGLAGLRVGLAVGPPALIHAIEKSRGPYKVGGVAERAAVAALEGDGAWVARVVDQVRVERERVGARLDALGVRTWPSATNFLLIGLGDRDAHEVRSRMKARGVGVRAFPDLPVAGSAIRLTLGPAVVNDRVLAVLEEVLA